VAIFKEIIAELSQSRWLITQLFKRDFLAMYRQTLIGVIWAIIIPLISLGTFIVLNQSGIFSVGTISVPYPVYAILGLAFWQLFATGLIASSNSLVNAGSMIKKINFSKKALVIAAMGQSIVPFLIQIVLLAILFVYYQMLPGIAILLIPILAVPIFFLTLGLGFILSILNGIARDVGNALSVMITFLMFLTPIFYVKPVSGILSTITTFNPLYYLVAGSRDIALTGTFDNPIGLALAIVLSFVIFFVCLVVFHLTETRVAERI
jgi:lipopolysaccharide transport system permease protein